MLERESIIRELWKRMSAVEGVAYTARNPKAPPSVDDLPAIQFFELPDKVISVSQRGSYPTYKRIIQVALEVVIAGTTEASTSKELGEFVQKTKKKLYEGGMTLGGRNCLLQETGATRVMRPPAGDNVSMIGFDLEIQYIEDTALLFG